MLLSVSLLLANPLSKIYQNDDPALGLLQALSIEAGILPLTSAGPVSGHDILRHIEKLEGSPLSESSKVKLKSLRDMATAPLSDPPIGARITLSPEFYANTDSSSKERDWVDRYNERDPFLYAEAESIFADTIYGTLTYSFMKRLNEEDFSGGSTNFPYVNSISETQLQNSVPHTAFIGVSGSRWAVVLGRDTLAWGNGNTGNLMIGNHVPYHDFLHVSMSNSKLRYTFLALPMNSIDSEGNAIIPDDDQTFWNTLFHGTLSRIYLTHRLEADVLSWLKISLTEGTLFYTSRMDLRMFNPLMFIHNFQNFGEVNNTMTLEVEATLAPRWLLHAQFLLDQFQTAGEQNAYDEEQIPPNAYAGLLALNYVRPLEHGFLKGYIEGVYTSPYVYLRAGDNTGNYGTDENTEYNLDLVHAVNMRYTRGSIAFLGYQYGPDTIVASTGLTYEHNNGFGLIGDLRLLIQGEKGLRIEDKDQQVVTELSELNRLSPTGTPTYSLIFGLGGYMTIAETNVRVKAKINWVNRWHLNDHTMDTQILLGANYSLHIL